MKASWQLITDGAEIEFLCIMIIPPHWSKVGKTATVNGLTHEISSPLLSGLSAVAAYAKELLSSNMRRKGFFNLKQLKKLTQPLVEQKICLYESTKKKELTSCNESIK